MSFLCFCRTDNICKASLTFVSVQQTNQPHIQTSNMEIREVLTCLEQSLIIRSELQKLSSLDFIADRYHDFIKSDLILQYKPDTFMSILKLNRVCDKFSGEPEVFDAVSKYIDHKKNQQNTALNVTEREELIRLIRFPTLTNEQFMKCITKDDTLLECTEKASIFQEIAGGEINTFGFSSDVRMAEHIVNSLPNANLINFRVSCNGHKTLVGYIDSKYTLFKVNTACVAGDVWLFNGKDKDVGATVQLKNKFGQTLAKGRSPLSQKTNKMTTFMIELKPLVVLKPDKEYILEIKYDGYDEMIRYEYHQHRDTPVMPYTITMDEIEIKFLTLNSMCDSIRFGKL